MLHTERIQSVSNRCRGAVACCSPVGEGQVNNRFARCHNAIVVCFVSLLCLGNCLAVIQLCLGDGSIVILIPPLHIAPVGSENYVSIRRDRHIYLAAYLGEQTLQDYAGSLLLRRRHLLDLVLDVLRVLAGADRGCTVQDILHPSKVHRLLRHGHAEGNCLGRIAVICVSECHRYVQLRAVVCDNIRSPFVLRILHSLLFENFLAHADPDALISVIVINPLVAVLHRNRDQCLACDLVQILVVFHLCKYGCRDLGIASHEIVRHIRHIVARLTLCSCHHIIVSAQCNFQIGLEYLLRVNRLHVDLRDNLDTILRNQFRLVVCSRALLVYIGHIPFVLCIVPYCSLDKAGIHRYNPHHNVMLLRFRRRIAGDLDHTGSSLIQAYCLYAAFLRKALRILCVERRRNNADRLLAVHKAYSYFRLRLRCKDTCAFHGVLVLLEGDRHLDVLGVECIEGISTIRAV